MRPITFTCDERLGTPPEEIAGQILDLTRWPEFRGYGVLPGIEAAEFEARTPEVVGTRIRVTNTDGSSHVEQIIAWEPERRLRLRMGEFSPPLSRLATGFIETWEFERGGEGTRVVRSFELHPKSVATRPVLWLISILLKRAVTRHLHQMREDAARRSHNEIGQSAPDREGEPWIR
jgi:Polyketide cyclase / dehydrase and lipid transport